MKRSIAFLLAMIMVVGMIPAALLPVLAHGIGVGVNDVQNLSIDNAPNQKIPATVTVDGLINDTAWRSDEWQVADHTYGIWDSTPVKNENFTYRYQLHLDYEFVYGVIEWDSLKASSGVSSYTIWINDGSQSNNYTAKVVIANGGDGYSINVYRKGSQTPVTTLATWTYEQNLVVQSQDETVYVLEFKVFLADILGKKIEKETVVNLSSFVSAEIDGQRFYHPRVDAARDNNTIDLTKVWPSGKAVEITRDMIYGTNLSADDKELTYNNQYVTDYGVLIDGALDEEAWKNFTNYGGSGYASYKDYERYGEKLIADYDVEYSVEYMYWGGEAAISDKGFDWVHYHKNDCQYPFTYNSPEYTAGRYNGSFTDAGANHVCGQECENAYMSDIPVKFKYVVKSNEEYLYGALVANVSMDDARFYNQKTASGATIYDTYFKVMVGAQAVEGGDYNTYTQLEMKHNIADRSIHSYSSYDNNTRTLTANSNIKGKGTDASGNTILPSDVGAYAKRISSELMVFEFCISYDQLNASRYISNNTGNAKFELGKELSIILTVSNQSSPVTHASPCANQTNWATNPYAGAVAADSAGYFAHAGLYDVLGRKNTHRYTFDGSDGEFAPRDANGTLDRGVFNGLLAADRFINSAYHQSNATTTSIPATGPAITATVGDTINLKTYTIGFYNAGSSASGSKQGVHFYNVNADGTMGTEITSKEVKVTQKGVTPIWARSYGENDMGNWHTDQMIYIVAKEPTDVNYTLYNPQVSKAYKAEDLPGWTVIKKSENEPVYYGGGMSFGNATVLLPEWLGNFGDYTFKAKVAMSPLKDSTTVGDTRWLSMVYRYQSETQYYQMCVRKNTTASNGIEFAEKTSSGWKIHETIKGPYANLQAPYEKESAVELKITVSGNDVTYYLDNVPVFTATNHEDAGNIKRGRLGISSDGCRVMIYDVEVTTDKVTPLVNQYGNATAAHPGATQYFDHEVFMDTEYLYGAAVVKKYGYEDQNSTTRTSAFNSNDVFRLYINNGVPQWRDYFDYRVSFYLDPEATNTVAIAELGNSYHSGYRGNETSDPQQQMNKGTEVFNLTDTTGVEFKRTLITQDIYDGLGTDVAPGEMVLVEFKIPLELLGISERYSQKKADGKSEVAVSYYASVGPNSDIDDPARGLVYPVPDNLYLDKDTQKRYVDRKVFAFETKDTVGGNVWGAWVSTGYSGVNGAKFIKTDARTNTVKVDGVLEDVIWNDEEERIHVNSYSGSWDVVPGVDHIFDYQYKVYTGREYIYGMAEINTAVSDGEELDFTLWINNNAAGAADRKFRIVQKGDKAVCYDLDGNALEMTYEEERWESGHDKTYVLEISKGKVAMTNDGKKTYVEFMYSLEALEVVTHEQGEGENIYVSGKGMNSDTILPESDIFFYYYDKKLKENKKNGYEYFVSVTRKCEEHTNTLYYPSVVDKDATTTAGASTGDKYCHLADTLSGDRWDTSNAHVITPTGYYVHEAINIDGKLTDSGWADDRWIEVQTHVNGNIQTFDYINATPGNYKYQMRVDNEYVYVALVLDVPASPIRYENDGVVTYSKPQLKFWIQSKDKEYSVDVTHLGKGSNMHRTYTYLDAVSFTHLYDLSLASNKEGETTTTSLNVDKATYEPSNYVTWEPSNVPHESASKYAKLNGDISEITYSGSALRFTTHDTGFYAPYGGNARYPKDPISALAYTVTNKNGSYTVNNNQNSSGRYLTNHEAKDYESSLLFGETKVIEENTVKALGPNGEDEKAYVDKDWYAKPEIRGYTYGNQHGVVTSDSTGTKTNIEFRFALSEIGCEDGDGFEYFIQAGTTGLDDHSGYYTFYPPISFGFDKADSRGDADVGRPYNYWGTNAVVVDEAEREYLMLDNSFGPVSNIGAQYDEKYVYEYEENGVTKSETYMGVKFGVLYNSDYIRQPGYADKNGHNPYINSNYWDVKEIGMLVGYTDSLLGDVSNLTTENIDNYNIYRMESDVILDQLKGTNMADYENYVYYAIQLLWPDEFDMKLTARGFVEYYPEDQIYYDMADLVFDNWSYSTNEDEGEYRGKPLTLAGVNGDPKKIPATWKFRETYYCEPVTRSINMIQYMSKNFAGGDTLPDTNKVQVPESVNHNLTPVVYVPLDNRPVNLDRVKFQAEAAGFRLILPEDEDISAMLESMDEGKSDQGNPRELYAWLKKCYEVDKYKYFVISVDQMVSGGLVGSREPYGDTDDSIANRDSLNNFLNGGQGYTLTADETNIVTLLGDIAKDPTTYTVYFDTIKRLACTYNYAGWDIDDYNLLRKYGGNAPEQLYGSELTIENIVSGYNPLNEDGGLKYIQKIDEYVLNELKTFKAWDGAPADTSVVDKNGNPIHTIQNYEVGDYYFRDPDASYTDANGTSHGYRKYYGLSKEKYAEFMAARERKLRIADALYPTLAEHADTFYVGYDDSKPQVTMQTNDGRYIEEKLIKGSDNTYVFAGTDELGSMGMADVVTHLYGSVSVNVEFFGEGKDWAGDDYDTGTLYQNVMTHINGIGANYSYDNEGDVDILILTRADGGKAGGKYTTAQHNELKNYAGQLIDRVAENLKNNKPTIVIDCAFEDGYLATMMMQRSDTNAHTADISKQLGELLSYSHWGTTANSLGIAISNGVSRYSYLKNSSSVTNESHQAAIKGLVESWVKDYGYRTGDSSGTFTSNNPFNSYKTDDTELNYATATNNFANEYNNFWELTDVIMSKLNSSKMVVGIDKDGKAVIDDSGYRASVSNLGWRWDRQHEANYDITVEEVENFTAPDYNDQKVTNLALGKTYKTSWSWNGTTETYEDYCGHTWVAEQDKYVSNYVEGGWNAGELTNGVRVYKAANNFGQGNDYWAGWSFAHTDADNFMIDSKRYFDIIIDLGGVYPVYQVNLDQLSRNDGEMGIYNVEKVQLFTSTTDSEDSFELQRTLKVKNFTPSESNIFRYYLGTDSGAVDARFVKVRVWQNTDSYKTWFFCSEIEVLGLDGTKAEYVDSVGLNFTYSVDGKTPYNIWDGTDFEGAGYMTHDDGKRLVMYYDGTNYSPNLLSPDNFFKFTKKTDGGSSRDVLSGWKVADGAADEIPFMLDIDGGASITQVAAHVGNEYAGLVKPRYAKLYMVAADGTETLIPTKFILTSIYDGDVNNDGQMESSNDNLEGYRYILEIANEGLYIPDDVKLKLCLGREADDGSNAYIFAGIQILGRKGNVYAQSEVVNDQASVKYEFIGDYAEKAGFAQGIITVNPIASETTTGNYLIYYTDDNGVLAGYDEIASIPITGSKVTYEIPDGIMIPEGATGIAVFESANAFEDSAPDISTAIATRAIPTAKRLSLGEADTVFGAVSDTHMNYDWWYDCDAEGKWERALEFFGENDAEYVIVTGDMTGDEDEEVKDGSTVTLSAQYQKYIDAITASGYTGPIYEALGNHGALSTDIDEFAAIQNNNQVHAYPGSPYYYVIEEGDSGEKDNVFIFMYLELQASTSVSGKKVFSDTQLNWLESTLALFDNDQNNVFVICHAPFLNYGAGDVYEGGGYTDLLKFTANDNDTACVLRLKTILQKHKDAIVMSGHTHLSFYENANYSDVSNEFAHTVHLSSASWPRAYDETGNCPAGWDGRYDVTETYGSEGYLVKVYDDYIVYIGYNLSTGKIIPAANIIIPTERYIPTAEEAFKGSGTAEDPYLIEDAQDFLLLTHGFSSDAHLGDNYENSYGKGKYFLQTADIDMTGIDAYMGTYAGSAKDVNLNAHDPCFGGIYNGNGYSITVDIDGLYSRSVFPYLYGTLVNLEIKGEISGTFEANTGGAAQPIARVYGNGNVINCVFDLDLYGRQTCGVTKMTVNTTNTANPLMHNVFTTGSHEAGINNSKELAYGIKTDAVNGTITNVFYDFGDQVLQDSAGQAASDLNLVVAAFNDRASSEYNAAMARITLNGEVLDIELCQAAVNGDSITLVNG